MRLKSIIGGAIVLAIPGSVFASVLGVQFKPSSGGTALSASSQTGVIPQTDFNVAITNTGSGTVPGPFVYGDASPAPETLSYSNVTDTYGTGTPNSGSDPNAALLSAKVGAENSTPTPRVRSSPLLVAPIRRFTSPRRTGLTTMRLLTSTPLIHSSKPITPFFPPRARPTSATTLCSKTLVRTRTGIWC
jgi:hypothetical protein